MWKKCKEVWKDRRGMMALVPTICQGRPYLTEVIKSNQGFSLLFTGETAPLLLSLKGTGLGRAKSLWVAVISSVKEWDGNMNISQDREPQTEPGSI